MSTTYSTLEDAALVRELAQLQHALVRARFQKSTGRLENTASLGVVRRDIARIRTEVRKREVAQGLSKDGLLAKHPVDGRTLTKASEAKSGSGFLQDVVDKLSG